MPNKETRAPRQSRERWSREDEQFLARHIHDRTWAQLAKRLRRSETAVKLKAYRLGLARDGEITYGRDELAHALGVTVYRVRQWRDRGWLPPRADGRYPRRGVRAFLAAHRDEIALARVQPDVFWEIVTEPPQQSESDGEGDEEVGD